MGLLNHLFGGKKGVAKELVMDDNKRMALWNEHLANYASREELSKHFNYGNIDKTLQDFNGTLEKLRQLEESISSELISVSDEEPLEKEIFGDLQRLRGTVDIESLSRVIIEEKQKVQTLLSWFQEIHDVLRAELHLIQVIRKRIWLDGIATVKNLLLRLFEIIFHHEARLYKVFREQYFVEENKHIHANIIRIARAIILEEEVKEEMETDEEKFARRMVNQMAPGESIKRYRLLGEKIFYELADRAGAPMSRGEDITEGIKRMEGFMKDDDIMYKIVKELRPKYDDIKIRGVILAFRQAYNLGHFEDLESEFAT